MNQIVDEIFWNFIKESILCVTVPTMISMAILLNILNRNLLASMMLSIIISLIIDTNIIVNMLERNNIKLGILNIVLSIIFFSSIFKIFSMKSFVMILINVSIIFVISNLLCFNILKKGYIRFNK